MAGRRPPAGGVHGLTRSLHASLRAPLGSRILHRSLTHQLRKPAIHGEPAKAPAEIAPDSRSRPGGAPWQAARAHHLQSHEHIRKARHTQIKGWRTSKTRVRPR